MCPKWDTLLTTTGPARHSFASELTPIVLSTGPRLQARMSRTGASASCPRSGGVSLGSRSDESTGITSPWPSLSHLTHAATLTLQGPQLTAPLTLAKRRE